MYVVEKKATSKYTNFKVGSNESIFNIIKQLKKHKTCLPYQNQLQELMENPVPLQLFCSWFEQLIHCVPIIDKDVTKLVNDLLKIPWQYGEKKVVAMYRDFILSLVTSQNIFCYRILEQMFLNLNPLKSADDDECKQKNIFFLEEKDKIAHDNIIQLIVDISKHVPMSMEYILKLAREILPYQKKDTYRHLIYVYNLLKLGEQLPQLKKEILVIIVSHMIKLDLNSPKIELIDEDCSDEEDDGEVFDMEMDTEDKNYKSLKQVDRGSTNHEIGHKLDILMMLMMRYIHFTVHGGLEESTMEFLLNSHVDFVVKGCSAGSVHYSDNSSQLSMGCQCNRQKHDTLATRKLYFTLKDVFTETLLPTQNISHVQYLLFYFFSVRPNLLSDFLDHLRGSFENFSQSRVVRKNVLAYLSSFLARGKFVSFVHIHSCNELLRDWCLAYLERFRNDGEDLQRHCTFYYACQALFYIFAFNYKKYTESKSRLKLAQSLRLDEISLCSLNPLRYCTEKVVESFAAVACHYQIAYCQTVIENNRRVLMPVASQNASGGYVVTATDVEMVFPFEVYLLKRSASYIEKYYVEFCGLPEVIQSDSGSKSLEEGNDHDPLFCTSPQRMSFSIDMSPGFR